MALIFLVKSDLLSNKESSVQILLPRDVQKIRSREGIVFLFPGLRKNYCEHSQTDTLLLCIWQYFLPRGKKTLDDSPQLVHDIR